MSNVQSVFKIHTRDKWSWLYIPTIILSSSFIVNLVVGYLIGSSEDFYTGGLSSIFIYTLVLGILVMVQTFPFALGMSVRRKDYFIGTATMGFISSVVIGLLIYVLATIENNTAGWGTGMHFFHFPYLSDGTSLEQIMINIILLTFFFFTGFLISSFARRFGGKGMLVSTILILLIISIALLLIHNFGLWIDIFHWFAGKSAVQIAYWLLPFIAIYLPVTYFLIRKSTV
ncbi:hypothetical protein [Bacillus sp. FJAT-50079]|uniref:hypothetical protein n=1 Tax=Bacillus sp. FJAT-50079 TaxID=2833577 RepID=UPI001BC94E1D|nr:hypothetical protein [Bacillus sp. FJAT-50079]MBS4210335.1 hypothetical protein [Bacillus sp. FJAT-50079]